VTFSIVARDPGTGDLGGAVQSKFLSVGSLVLHGRAGAGMVATQAWANVSYGPRGLDLLAAGATAPQALEVLVGGDDQPGVRQAAVVDAAGRVAAHTGGDCPDWAGHHTGDGFSCQGNILVSAATVAAMAAAMRERADLELPERLVAALEAGQAAGGDARGQQSAALLVVREGGGYGGRSDRHIDLRVDDHPTPIAELAGCSPCTGATSGGQATTSWSSSPGRWPPRSPATSPGAAPGRETRATRRRCGRPWRAGPGWRTSRSGWSGRAGSTRRRLTRFAQYLTADLIAFGIRWSWYCAKRVTVLREG
jgi:uncharacterized Ntn-hydrolase superfamily protein